ncbi:NAD(P)H-binding protein [Cytophaga sp. FL35]|uniref:NAD(P)H-binding protein n=1 Tax=Cytophaga sp. FL35 TaxID=1904456 RepID=UPI001653D80B|nr:NAD(P)H-binding protein [Cytophaga sp. FL35]MBC6997292.1 NAD(P)H-binding protein [Cytophaga sp. FL35]
MNKIAVMGCGWLGLPLAKALLAKNFSVKGSTTSNEKLLKLKELGIEPALLILSETEIKGNIHDFLTDVDILIINIPPRLRSGNGENYVKKMQLVYEAILKSSVKKIVFVSSTSVYGDVQGEVDEYTPPNPTTESGKQLTEVEKIFKEAKNFETTLVRFGGLIGPNRHPVTMLSGRKNLKNGHHPINLIHLNDCIKIIEEIILNNWWNETFNGVYPYHPAKSIYYNAEAKKRSIQPFDYEKNNAKSGKTVRSKNLISVKGFKFTTTL